MRIDDGVFSAEVMEDEDLTAGTRAIRASNIRHAMRPVSLLLLLVQGFFVFLIPAAMFFSGAAYLIEFAHKRRRASAGFEILPPLRA